MRVKALDLLSRWRQPASDETVASPADSDNAAATYTALAPASENGFSLFPGLWTSRLPAHLGIDGPGTTELFGDPRLTWALSELGGVEGFDVLELGSLEGAHTYILEQAGANVLGIEANELAFLRCLITKNGLGLRARFLLGDFTQSFGEQRRWDLVIAAGVLYHMTDPLDLLERIAQATDRVYIWTHFFEPDSSVWEPNVRELIGEKWLVDDTTTVRFHGRDVRLVPQRYGAALAWGGFCGGSAAYSHWLYRDDLLGVLRDLGFADIRIDAEQLGHPNGPACSILAQR